MGETQDRHWCALAVGLVVACGVACGGDGGGNGGFVDARPPADARPPDASPDAGFENACEKFDEPYGTLSSYPGEITGSIDGAAAMLEPTAGQCAVENVDPARGVKAPGPEVVIALTGLTGGTEYVATVNGAEDLAFYVATGCGGETTFLAGECLLFSDSSGGHIESRSFTAPVGGTAYVVVDYDDDTPPDDGSFTLTVAEPECDDNTDCTMEGLPVCLNRSCVQCVSDFDCKDPSAPICSGLPDYQCGAGFSMCVGDDPAPVEDGDDGPAGAIDVTPDVSGMATATAKICSAPKEEVDYYKITVTEAGASYSLSLDWTDMDADLDLSVLNGDDRLMGLSYWEQPEPILLTYLPVGDIYIEVKRYTRTADATVVDYTLTVLQGATVACVDTSDCATEFRNQNYRGSCTDGACNFFIGNETVALGGACDSQSDCVPEASYCTAFDYTSDADSRGRCSIECSLDTECGDGELCHTSLSGGFCAPPCTRDEHCPPDITDKPTAGAWAYPVCELASGRCGG